MIYSAIQCLAFCTGSNYIKVFNFAFISNMNHVLLPEYRNCKCEECRRRKRVERWKTSRGEESKRQSKKTGLTCWEGLYKYAI